MALTKGMQPHPHGLDFARRWGTPPFLFTNLFAGIVSTGDELKPPASR